jgi:hypothetical protein
VSLKREIISLDLIRLKMNGLICSEEQFFPDIFAHEMREARKGNTSTMYVHSQVQSCQIFLGSTYIPKGGKYTKWIQIYLPNGHKIYQMAI